jgi:phage antirepressor YoqD-like protein
MASNKNDGVIMHQLMHVSNSQMMSSKKIAELTEKRHDHVIRDIRETMAQLDAPKLGNEQYQELKDARGYVSEILLDEELTTLLITGYSVKARMRVIQELKSLKQSQPQPLTLEQLIQQNVTMIQDLSQKVVTLEHAIQQDKPMTDFGKAVSASPTAVLIGDWIKALAEQGMRIGRNKAFDWMREKGYLMPSNMPYQQYVNQGLFEVKESLVATPKGQKVNFTTLLTGKGQVYFASKLKTDLAGV